MLKTIIMTPKGKFRVIGLNDDEYVVGKKSFQMNEGSAGYGKYIGIYSRNFPIASANTVLVDTMYTHALEPIGNEDLYVVSNNLSEFEMRKLLINYARRDKIERIEKLQSELEEFNDNINSLIN